MLLNFLRGKFPWYPTLDPGACRQDLQCLNYCPHDVFEWDPQTGRPFVAHPVRCLPGCDICLQSCDTGAISLPTKHEFQITLKNLRGTGRKSRSSSPRK
jgi:NAD-dependent dihydropyrimidine dehydrogenase PreA subunit